MINAKKILWIEEETLSMMANYRGYIDASLDYELTVVDNLKEATDLLPTLTNFHKIILDIRIYRDTTNEFDTLNKHGFEFLEIVAKINKAYFTKIIILTNEHITELDLNNIGFPKSQYFSKGEIRSTIALEEKILK